AGARSRRGREAQKPDPGPKRGAQSQSSGREASERAGKRTQGQRVWEQSPMPGKRDTGPGRVGSGARDARRVPGPQGVQDPGPCEGEAAGTRDTEPGAPATGRGPEHGAPSPELGTRGE